MLTLLLLMRAAGLTDHRLERLRGFRRCGSHCNGHRPPCAQRPCPVDDGGDAAAVRVEARSPVRRVRRPADHHGCNLTGRGDRGLRYDSIFVCAQRLKKVYQESVDQESVNVLE